MEERKAKKPYRSPGGSETASLIGSTLGILDSLGRQGSRPVSGASAAAFRIVFGLLGVAAVVRFAAKGWISDLYIEPAHHFTYSGFWWVQPWPAWGMYVHFALLGLAGLCVALGFKYRFSIVSFFLLFTYVELIDKTTYLNHYYWVSLASLLMVFLPLDRYASFDAWRNPALRSPTVPVWVIWALRAQVGVVYVFGGIAKLNPDWLFNAQPLRIWLFNSGSLPLLGSLLGETWVAYAMSMGGVLFDLTIVGWLLWGRNRPLAYAVLCAFHIATWLLFPIGMFPWIMMGASLVFFSPTWARPLIGRLDFSERSRVEDRPCNTFQSSLGTRIATAALLTFALVQVIVPLRHWAYPGNVRWNEDGYRFSWRVMLTEKTGHVQYRVTDVDTGREWLAHPEDYLTPVQTERMAYQPDMILALAHIIAEDASERGRNVKVRADSFVTFNGRPAARFVDPDVDLTSVHSGIGPKSWVLPQPP